MKARGLVQLVQLLPLQTPRPHHRRLLLLPPLNLHLFPLHQFPLQLQLQFPHRLKLLHLYLYQ